MYVEHVGREHCLGKEVASEEEKVDGWKHFDQVESDVGFTCISQPTARGVARTACDLGAKKHTSTCMNILLCAWIISNVLSVASESASEIIKAE